MLVLSRRSGEKIVIGPSVVIEVIAVRGGKVKFACTAPAGIAIVRKEPDIRSHDCSTIAPTPAE